MIFGLRSVTPILAVMFVFSFTFGVITGAGAAAQAEATAPQIDVGSEVAETRAEMVTGATERDNPVVPDELEEPVVDVQLLPEWATDAWRRAIAGGVVGFLAIGLHLGNLGMTVGFELSRLVPPSVIGTLASGVGYLSVGILLIWKVLEVQRILRA